ncbi:MAG: hypothetical protein NZX77_11815 [Polyangiaceae bacterium]|nr:hypothetical protein [Polyangiaceae bacterium]
MPSTSSWQLAVQAWREAGSVPVERWVVWEAWWGKGGVATWVGRPDKEAMGEVQEQRRVHLAVQAQEQAAQGPAEQAAQEPGVAAVRGPAEQAAREPGVAAVREPVAAAVRGPASGGQEGRERGEREQGELPVWTKGRN